MQKIALVTGAAGLVGGELTQQLLSQKGQWEVHCAIRGEGAGERLAKKLETIGFSIDSVKVHFVDLEDFEQVSSMIADILPEVVFHTAAKVSLSDKDGEKMVQGNVDITHFIVKSLLEIKNAERDPLLVHVSSIAAFGTTDPKGMIDESTPFTDITHASAYARSKFLSQNDVIKASKIGLKTVIVNPSVVVGINSGLGQMQTLFEMIRKGIPFYPNGLMGYVDVRDVARAMIILSSEPRSWGEMYCLNGANLTFRDMITVFGAPFKRQKPNVPIGKCMLTIARGATWIYGKITGKKQLITKSIVDYMTQKASYDGSKIENAIPSFKYTKIENTAQYIADNL